MTITDFAVHFRIRNQVKKSRLKTSFMTALSSYCSRMNISESQFSPPPFKNSIDRPLSNCWCWATRPVHVDGCIHPQVPMPCETSRPFAQKHRTLRKRTSLRASGRTTDLHRLHRPTLVRESSKIAVLDWCSKLSGVWILKIPPLLCETEMHQLHSLGRFATARRSFSVTQCRNAS